MIITKSRIVHIRQYLSHLPAGASFRIVVALDDEKFSRLPSLGFAASPQVGDTVLPKPMGTVSRFNSEGRWVIRRDLPKELRYVRTVHWRWQQWTSGGGSEEHEDFCDLYRKCFQREFVAPPSVELTYNEKDGVRLIVVPEMQNDERYDEPNKHVVNLLLELFGTCELVAADLTRIAPVALRKVNWRLLPPGKYPWDRLEEAIDDAIARISEGARRVIWDRQITLQKFGPDEIFIGEGGYSDYIAYIFQKRGFVVLESIRHGNAIYVFGSDWQRVSRLTKAEVLSKHFHLVRIVHTKGWKRKLAEMFDKSSAA